LKEPKHVGQKVIAIREDTGVQAIRGERRKRKWKLNLLPKENGEKKRRL